MNSRRLSTLAVAACLCAAGTVPRAAERRAITEKDLFKFVWIADPQISPDGSQVAFVRVSVDEKTDQYDTAIWLAPTGGDQPPRRLTGGTRDHSPRWSPDGARLAFVRSAERDRRVQPPQVYVMAMAGGDTVTVQPTPLEPMPAMPMAARTMVITPTAAATTSTSGTDAFCFATSDYGIRRTRGCPGAAASSTSVYGSSSPGIYVPIPYSFVAQY